MRLSPNKRFVAALGRGGTCIIDLDSGKRTIVTERGCYRTHIAFSADSQRVAVVGNNDQIQIHSTSDGKLTQNVQAKGHASCVSFADQDHLTYYTSSERVIVDLAGGDVDAANVSEGPVKFANVIAASNDNNLLLVGRASTDGPLRINEEFLLLDLTSREAVWQQDHAWEAAALSDDGKRIAFVDVQRSKIVVYDSATGRSQPLEGPRGSYDFLTFADSGRLLFARSRFRVYGWDLNENRLLPLSDAPEEIRSLRVLHDHSAVVAQDAADQVWVFELPTLEKSFTLTKGHGLSITGRSNQIWRRSELDELIAYNSETGEADISVELPREGRPTAGEALEHFEISPNGQSIAYWKNQGNQIGALGPVGVLAQEQGEVGLRFWTARWKCAYSKDGSYFAYVNEREDGLLVSIVNPKNGTLVREVEIELSESEAMVGNGDWHGDDYLVCVWQEDEPHVFSRYRVSAVGGDNGVEQEFNLDAVDLNRDLDYFYDEAYTFDPAGSIFCYGDSNGAIQLVDIQTGKLLQTIESRQRGVTAIVWIGVDRFVSAGEGGSLVLWGAHHK